jgi:hypothetical protein
MNSPSSPQYGLERDYPFFLGDDYAAMPHEQPSFVNPEFSDEGDV